MLSNILRLTILIACLLPAHAEERLSAKKLLEHWSGNADFQNDMQREVAIVEVSVSTANAINEAEGKAPLYCLPQTFVVQRGESRGKQLMDILRQEVETRPPKLGDFYWGLVLIEGLRRVFPCGVKAR